MIHMHHVMSFSLGNASAKCEQANETNFIIACFLFFFNATQYLGTIQCDAKLQLNSSSTPNHYVPFYRICDNSDDCFDETTSEFIDEESCARQTESVKDMQCPFGGTTNPLRPLHATRCDDR